MLLVLIRKFCQSPPIPSIYVAVYKLSPTNLGVVRYVPQVDQFPSVLAEQGKRSCQVLSRVSHSTGIELQASQ